MVRQAARMDRVDRTQALEEQVAHLIRTVEELSDVMARQAREIDALIRRVALLTERTAGPDGDGATFTDQRPPHW